MGTYIKQGKQISKGHYNTACNFYKKYWHKGSPEECENHLANLCPKVPLEIRDLFLKKKVEDNLKKLNKKRKLNEKQSQTK
ncbi:2975_t:CDS:1, partial [Diversispora eburnea]